MLNQKIIKFFLLFVFVVVSVCISHFPVQAAIQTIDQLSPNTPAYYYSASTYGLTSTKAVNYVMPILQANTVNEKDAFELKDTSGTNDLLEILKNPETILGYTWSNRYGWFQFSYAMNSGNINDFVPQFADIAGKRILKGYSWNRWVGWVQLSSTIFNPNNAQNASNWGVYLDGNNFKGYAWGQYIGWIDFKNVTFNSATGKFGGYACHAASLNDVVDCASNDNKIYFDKIPNGAISTGAGTEGAWGVSKNMSSVMDNQFSATGNLIPWYGLSNTNGKIEMQIGNFLATKTVPTLGGEHTFTAKITNRFGQTYTGTQKYRVLLLDCGNPSGNNAKVVCEDPQINLTLVNTPAIADGIDQIKINAELKGGSGVVDLNNLDGVSYFPTLSFNNKVRRDQLSSAVNYNAVNGTTSVGLYIDKNTPLTSLTSLAPTRTPDLLILSGSDFIISLPLTTYFTPASYVVSQNSSLTFNPALTATIQNVKPLQEGVESSFEIKLQNQSANKTLSQIALNTFFDAITVYADLSAKTSGAYSLLTKDEHELVSNTLNAYKISSQLFNSTNKILSNSLTPNTSQVVTFKINPVVILGGAFDLTETIQLLTKLDYVIAGNAGVTRYKSGEYNLTNNIVARQVDIKGLASGKNIQSIIEGENYVVTSNMTFAEISEEIQKNVADLTRNEIAGDLSSPKTIASWATGNRISGGKNLYYKGDKILTIGNGSDFTVGDSQGTIIVFGGDVYIKNRIKYANTNQGSFGLIVMKDSTGKGGNVYIDPSVNNLVGGFYLEGSLMSATDSSGSFKVIDGSDTTTSLANQLLLKGTLISRNTIGGSRQSPLKFPEGVASACGTTKECAERYDLNYLRDFSMSGSIVLNGGIKSIGTTSASPFVIEYDSRIQSNIPPGFDLRRKIDFSEVIR